MTVPRENSVEFIATYDGEALREHTMAVRDPEFAKEVLEGRSFSRDDLLICQIGTVQRIDGGVLKTEREILR